MKLTRSYLEGGGAASAMVGAVVFALVSLSAMLANENWPAGVGEGSPPVVEIRSPPVAGASSSSGAETFSAGIGLGADLAGASARRAGRGGDAGGRSSSSAGAGSSSGRGDRGGGGSGGGGGGSPGSGSPGATPVAPGPAPPPQGAPPGQGGAPPGQGGAGPGKGGTKPGGGSPSKPPSVTTAGKSDRVPPGQIQRATGAIGQAGVSGGNAKGTTEGVKHPGKADEKQLRPAAKATAAKASRR